MTPIRQNVRERNAPSPSLPLSRVRGARARLILGTTVGLSKDDRHR